MIDAQHPTTLRPSCKKQLMPRFSDTFPGSVREISMIRLPHPLPYQGSKRSLVPLIAPHVPQKVDVWFEPFAGSAAMTIWAANRGAARHYVLGESLAPIAELWQSIINKPTETAARYKDVWEGQKAGDLGYFNSVRERYNSKRDPIDLLYLVCRCVKNAVRFNRSGAFTQSVDKRRLGMRPTKMANAIEGVAFLLRGRTEIRVGDWLETTVDAKPQDFLYMDPPYLGTSIGKDKRYAHQMEQERLVAGLQTLLNRRVRFALSYDGTTGGKEYGPPLPDELGLTRFLLHAGISSQSTLNGKTEETLESLYLSPGLAENTSPAIQKRHKAVQRTLAL